MNGPEFHTANLTETFWVARRLATLARRRFEPIIGVSALENEDEDVRIESHAGMIAIELVLRSEVDDVLAKHPAITRRVFDRNLEALKRSGKTSLDEYMSFRLNGDIDVYEYGNAMYVGAEINEPGQKILQWERHLASVCLATAAGEKISLPDEQMFLTLARVHQGEPTGNMMDYIKRLLPEDGKVDVFDVMTRLRNDG